MLPGLSSAASIPSTCSHLPLCSLKLLQDLRSHARSKALLLTTRPLCLLSCLPITFQRLSSPKPSLLQPINSRRRQQQEEEPQEAPAAVDLTHLPQWRRDIFSLFHVLGLRQSPASPGNGGFLNTFRLMQHKALQLNAQGGDSTLGGATEEKGSILDGTGDDTSGSSSATVEVLGSKAVPLEVDQSGAGTGSVISVVDDIPLSSSDLSVSRAARIRERLERELCPVELQVEDVSYQHAGHAGIRGNTDGETHFNVRIVSKEFEGKSLIKRHRLVYDLLQEELKTGLHALSIVAKTPSEVGTK